MLLNQKIPLSFFTEKIRREALFIFVYVNILFVFKHYHKLDELNIPLAIPALVGTSISLLLAFRTNQAYDRWWEARGIWGAIVNDSRTLVRQIQIFIKRESFESKNAKECAHRQIAWCYVLGSTLRRDTTSIILGNYVEKADELLISASTHKPLEILQLHALQIKRLYIDGLIGSIEAAQIDATLSRLTDSMGKCERIKNTVFPKTYSFYIQFLIIIFTTLLPFGFAEKLFYVEVPVITLISSAFFLIEKSAAQLQDPFENKPTDVPISTISEGIEMSLKQMIGESSVCSKPVSIDSYYVL